MCFIKIQERDTGNLVYKIPGGILLTATIAAAKSAIYMSSQPHIVNNS